MLRAKDANLSTKPAKKDPGKEGKESKRETGEQKVFSGAVL